ncbi:hypothetical protein [uncultured Clostridium sp.]|uniref:hypothetical protein n=1 Tax=uncultured Clostridium sp. TaxID=59620 RepID=UPI003217894D
MNKDNVMKDIKQHFVEYGYSKLQNDDVVFDCIYESTEERYYIKFFNKIPNLKEIKNIEYQNIYPKIIKMSNEDIKKYNMNFIICCDLKDNYTNSDVVLIERDQNNCRKILINTESHVKMKEDFMMLPFTKIEQNFKVQDDLKEIMMSIIDVRFTNAVYNEDISLEMIRKLFWEECNE